MAPIIPDPRKIKSFRTEASFAAWMKANHARETELWLRIYKKGSGLPTVANAQALDVALCWGGPSPCAAAISRSVPRPSRQSLMRFRLGPALEPHGHTRLTDARGPSRHVRADRHRDQDGNDSRRPTSPASACRGAAPRSCTSRRAWPSAARSRSSYGDADPDLTGGWARIGLVLHFGRR